MRFIVPLLVAFLTISCEGPVGPEGPQGPQGIQGVQGEKGDQGVKGDPGNANVATITIEIDESDYTPYRSTITGRILWDEATYNVSEITQEVAENGAVIGYWGSGDYWLVLPNLGIDFVFETGQIEVRIDRYPSGGSPLEIISGTDFRFVIIYPPSTEIIKDVDISDYDAVMEALEIF